MKKNKIDLKEIIMTTSKQTLQQRIAELINDQVDWAEWGKDDNEGYLIADKILSLFKQTVEEIIGEDEKLSKEHAMSELIINNFRAFQRQKLQEILK